MHYFTILGLYLMAFAYSATAVHADNFVPLSPDLPVIGPIGSSVRGVTGVAGLLNGLFTLTIASAAILAVIMVAIGGFEYMTTDSAFKMGNAKERITNAIIGLLIILVAILFLEFINPCIVQLRLFADAPASC